MAFGPHCGDRNGFSHFARRHGGLSTTVAAGSGRGSALRSGGIPIREAPENDDRANFQFAIPETERSGMDKGGRLLCTARTIQWSKMVVGLRRDASGTHASLLCGRACGRVQSGSTLRVVAREPRPIPYDSVRQTVPCQFLRDSWRCSTSVAARPERRLLAVRQIHSRFRRRAIQPPTSLREPAWETSPRKCSGRSSFVPNRRVAQLS